MNLATAQWEPLPDGMVEMPGLGRRYEICPTGLMRTRSLREDPGGTVLDCQVKRPQVVNRRPVYVLSHKKRHFYVPLEAVLRHYGYVGAFDLQAEMKRVVRLANNENARLRRLKAVSTSTTDDEFRKQVFFVPSFCPWASAQVRGEAMGADPVLGF